VLLLALVLAAGAALAYALLGGDADNRTTTPTTTATTAATTTAPELVTMPALGGQRVGVARRRLEALGLRVEIREVFEARPAAPSSARASGRARRSSAGAPSRCACRRGPQPVPVPDVVGAARAAAQTTLTEAGFKVTVQEAPSDDVPGGHGDLPGSAAAAQGSAATR
jgi:serine/threonine-protein kinase